MTELLNEEMESFLSSDVPLVPRVPTFSIVRQFSFGWLEAGINQTEGKRSTEQWNDGRGEG